MHIFISRLLISLLALSLHEVCAMDLVKAWELALANNPRYQSARYAQQSNEENVAMARARLLPNANFNSSVSLNNQEHEYLKLPKSTENNSYTSQRYSLSIKQPLLNLSNYYGFKESQDINAASERTLESELQTLVVNVADAYFETLLATERFENITNRTEFYRSSLQMAEKSFENGYGTRTDIEDARARLDSAVADESEAKNAINIAEHALAGVIGEQVLAASLGRIAEDKPTLNLLSPATLEEWIALVKNNNPEIASMQYNLEASEKEIDRRRAGGFPTIDAIASKNLSRSDSDYTVNNQYNTDSIGLQLAMPLYSGGGIDASVRQAIAEREKTRFNLDSTTKKLEIEVSKQFASIQQGAARIKALTQAKKSAREAITGNQKGIRAGTRNIIDLLNVVQQHYIIQTNLIEARHAYVTSYLKLKAAAGLIRANDINEVNSWLTNI